MTMRCGGDHLTALGRETKVVCFFFFGFVFIRLSFYIDSEKLEINGIYLTICMTTLIKSARIDEVLVVKVKH